jgi:hypothetical protein
MLSFKETYTLPFKFWIPNYIDIFLKNMSAIYRRSKYFKRYIYIILKGQGSLEIQTIGDRHKNILWINYSAPSLGDSLMDLSSRILLENKKVDLLTNDKNGQIFASDELFRNVFTNQSEIISNYYDLVILDSYSTRSIRLKSEVAALVEYVGMFGYFNGPEVNRVLFSFHRMNHLLGYSKTESQINLLAKCYMTISKDDKRLVSELKLPDKFIAIVLGGEWEYRTYTNWVKVIEHLLLLDNSMKIVTIGSDNAIKINEIILEKFPESNLTSFIAKYTFNQTAQIISKSMLLICCDGGLMHAANSLRVRVLPMFARLNAEMQLTQSSIAHPLSDEFDVNNIPYEEVIMKYCEIFNLDYNDHQSE